MKLFSNSKRSSENIYLEDSILDQEKKERKKIKLPKINKSYSNLYTGSLNKTVNNINDEEKTNAQNNNKSIKFEKIDYAKKIKEANEMKELKKIYNSNYKRHDDALYCPDPNEWTDEDAWDAMTDGQYGDYPGSGWDPQQFGY